MESQKTGHDLTTKQQREVSWYGALTDFQALTPHQLLQLPCQLHEAGSVGEAGGVK